MDPIFELKKAIIDRLKATASIVALCADRIYDVPPKDVTTQGVSPYISMGPCDATSENFDCIDGMEIFMQINVWSWGSGDAASSAQASKIADLVRRALRNADVDLPLAQNALVTFEHRTTRILRAADGLTNQAAISMTAVVETH